MIFIRAKPLAVEDPASGDTVGKRVSRRKGPGISPLDCEQLRKPGHCEANSIERRAVHKHRITKIAQDVLLIGDHRPTLADVSATVQHRSLLGSPERGLASKSC